MNIIESYLDELFGFSKHKKSKYTDPNGKGDLFGVSVEYTSPQEKGEEICKELEDKNRERTKKDFLRKCGKFQDDSKEKDICELKNKIDNLNELLYDLAKYKNRCGNLHTICWDVIADRVQTVKREIESSRKELKDLERSK